MKTILLIFLITNGEIKLHTVEFDTLAACDQAARIINDIPPPRPAVSTILNAVCLFKGAK